MSDEPHDADGFASGRPGDGPSQRIRRAAEAAGRQAGGVGPVEDAGVLARLDLGWGEPAPSAGGSPEAAAADQRAPAAPAAVATREVRLSVFGGSLPEPPMSVLAQMRPRTGRSPSPTTTMPARPPAASATVSPSASPAVSPAAPAMVWDDPTAVPPTISPEALPGRATEPRSDAWAARGDPGWSRDDIGAGETTYPSSRTDPSIDVEAEPSAPDDRWVVTGGTLAPPADLLRPIAMTPVPEPISADGEGSGTRRRALLALVVAAILAAAVAYIVVRFSGP